MSSGEGLKPCGFQVKYMYTLKTAFLDKQETFKPLQQKEFADGNFKFDENGRKFSRWVETIVGKAQTKDLYCRHVKTRACLGKG